MNATCKKCGKDLGGIEAGVPVTTNDTIRYENGTACVRWVHGSPVLYGHTCTACEWAVWLSKVDRVRAAGRGRLADLAARNPAALTAHEYAIIQEDA
jgi:hypothetical protein